MAENSPKDSYEWTFPDMKSELDNADTDLLGAYSANNEDNDNVYNSTNEKEKKESQSADEESLHQEIKALKTDYEEKSAVFKNLFSQLQKTRQNFDNELIALIEDIIKKIVKKIIYKEISVDPGIMNEVINQLTLLIQPTSGIVTVFMSESDYKQLYEADNTISNAVCVDNSLSRGDVILKSNFTELKAILNERLDQIIGVENV
jgi:flagellar biosynthesis/type III secretory pathway protein FliH